MVTNGARHTWSLEQMLETVRAGGQSADPSSVFRAALALMEEGVLERIDLGDGRSYFEASSDHHDHIRCDSCGAVAEVPDCLLTESETAVETSTGYAVTSHRLVFAGLCPSCRGGGRPATSEGSARSLGQAAG
jgi:Fe2+ or Zn2+ uptake regulation protein